MTLHELTLLETLDGLRQKKFSAVEVTTDYLNRIKKYDKEINSYITVAEESALTQAKDADKRRAAGEDSLLLGIPIAIKDNQTTVGIRTTAASKILENYLPSYDATSVKKIKEAGAIILGKTNLDEFAHGASTEYSAFGVTKNPWDQTRVPGGSSGGSAAAVAADLAAVSLGSDTGGSIRQPASFCGVVGLKTSYGRVSRSGLLSMTSSTDVIGPIAKDVADAALLLGVIAGEDNKDQTCAPDSVQPDQYLKIISSKKDLSGITLGVPRDFISAGVDSVVLSVIDESIKQLQALGAKVVDIKLPHASYSVPVYYVITPSEVSSNLARYDGIRFGYNSDEAKNLYDVYAKSRGQGFGREAKRRIMIGTYALSYGYYDAYYLQAQRVRTLITQELDEAFRSVDAILTPVSPHVAFKIGENINDPIKMYLEDVFMVVASLAGLPALSLPVGFSKPEKGNTEMPVGLQIIGRRFDEATILSIGKCYEGVINWRSKKPSL